MRRPTPQRAVAVVAVVGLVGLSVDLWSSRPRPASEIAPPSSSRPRRTNYELAASPRCAELAARYVALRDAKRACASDADCQVEGRGEQWFELDGCWRFTRRDASLVEVDAAAKAWMEDGCAHEYEPCGRIAAVACTAGRCEERPPAPIPRDWVRHDLLRHSMSIFLPPDMGRAENHSFESIALDLPGERFSVWLTFGDQPTGDDGGPGDPLGGPYDVVTRKEAATLDGRPARLAWGARNGSPWVDAFFADLSPCPSGMCLFTFGPQALQVRATCRDPAAMDLAEIAVRSIELW